jgi:hypothetical protein
MRKIIFIIIIAFIFAGCSSIDCPLNNKVLATYQIGEVDTLEDTITVSTTRQTEGDTVLLNKATIITSFSIPMSYANQKDVLFFTINSHSNSLITIDTVVIDKKDAPHFESVDCNPSYFHTILGVNTTHNAIDSIIVANHEVNYDTTKPNFKIYFK